MREMSRTTASTSPVPVFHPKGSDQMFRSGRRDGRGDAGEAEAASRRAAARVAVAAVINFTRAHKRIGGCQTGGKYRTIFPWEKGREEVAGKGGDAAGGSQRKRTGISLPKGGGVPIVRAMNVI
eukprot:CAMPEP_0113322934 /NCGR_PEP_ID=MMETSP0010_2-20120614/15945_1 /TAXON_ID=216773 ORGANISM="Corethron hystrix, Strain 308" /NCGR_SAMPLE_ID=MMETSP0010_2 /ASSEMBLY_ACC=CAM_ASM_000155 /LENGTH=123 /DNA_ID=CAMNT_0000181617 /DNA_START=134 /DNA_END=503 /DNA_ORIENTATION=- /assembly_acc=CAM_ASM_000155